jgi:hypothetical protein
MALSASMRLDQRFFLLVVPPRSCANMALALVFGCSDALLRVLEGEVAALLGIDADAEALATATLATGVLAIGVLATGVLATATLATGVLATGVLAIGVLAIGVLGGLACGCGCGSALLLLDLVGTAVCL